MGDDRGVCTYTWPGPARSRSSFSYSSGFVEARAAAIRATIDLSCTCLGGEATDRKSVV